jgi:hypothetical protein
MSRPYIIGFKPNALNQLKRLDRVVVERILDKLLWLARNILEAQHDARTGQ